MARQPGNKVVIIGCGNVAWHIASKARSLKYEVMVYNHRSNGRLMEFKKKLGCTTVNSLNNIINNGSVYFICVEDKHIGDAAKKISIANPNAILLHTSGSVKAGVLGNRAHASGVFYPLQTFSVNDEISWSEVPLIIEAAPGDAEMILAFAKKFSRTCLLLDYQQRIRLHLAAVLVNNFPNALYQAASDLLDKQGKNKQAGFELLLPLIRQTTKKVQDIVPLEAQTGPAKRRDKPVIKKHLALLAKHGTLKKIYLQMTKLIMKQQERA
jgi:predicted short-subunit dehydrogenase-like oxidoreductase (DUF2520 family)